MVAEIIAPQLRVWRNAGLEAVLLDTPERAEDLKRHSALSPSVAASRQNMSIPPQQRSALANNKQAVGISSHRLQPPSHKPAERALETTHATAAPDGKVILPVSAWPPAWVALRNRRPLPAKPLVVWTYTGLEEDLLGEAVVARQQVVVRMLTALKHPSGTHVFWPYALPSSGDAVGTSSGSLFWSGVELLQPRVLLLFGEESAKAIGGVDFVPYGQKTIRGKRVVLLPAAMELAQDDIVFSRTLPFLSRLLSFCASRLS